MFITGPKIFYQQYYYGFTQRAESCIKSCGKVGRYPADVKGYYGSCDEFYSTSQDDMSTSKYLLKKCLEAKFHKLRIKWINRVSTILNSCTG